MIWLLLSLFATSFAVTSYMAPKPRQERPDWLDLELTPREKEWSWERELEKAEARDRELFAADPTAFWNDPHRYGGLRKEEWDLKHGSVPAGAVPLKRYLGRRSP